MGFNSGFKVLRWILTAYDVRVWFETNWLRLGYAGVGSSERGEWTGSLCIQRKISWLTKNSDSDGVIYS